KTGPYPADVLNGSDLNGSDLNDSGLNGSEMRQVLRICGYPMSGFAGYLGRSDSYVKKTLQSTRGSIPRSDQEALARMVTSANFEEAVRRIRGKQPQKY